LTNNAAEKHVFNSIPNQIQKSYINSKKDPMKKFNLSIRDRIPISYVVLEIKTFQLTAKAKQINASLNDQLKNYIKNYINSY
jgi:hypothetical protein